MNKLLTKFLLMLLIASGLSLSGCVVVPAHSHRMYVGGVVRIAPPPLRVETIGVAPAPGYVWINGYWSWTGNHHVWVAGRWEAPRPGYRWVPHRWYHERDGWHLAEGHWDRR